MKRLQTLHSLGSFLVFNDINGNPQGTARVRAAGDTMRALFFLFASAFVGVYGFSVSMGARVCRSKDNLQCCSLPPTLLEAGSRLLLYIPV